MKSNPEAIRAWQDRSRQKQREKPRERVAIRKVSTKRAGQLREYSKQRLEYFFKNPFCVRCGSMGHTRVATDIHHAAGREGERLNDTDDWRGLCRPCHDWAHAHPVEAKAAGWSISRISNVTPEEYFK